MQIEHPNFALVLVLSILSISSSNAEGEHKSRQSANEINSINASKDMISESLEVGLKAVALNIAEVIISKDIHGLLKYIGPNVHYGGDLYKSLDEVTEDLEDSTSAIYCFLFNIGCYPGDLQKSIRDYLVEAQSRNLRVKVEIERIDDQVIGTIIYDWDGKPDDLWVYKFPNPEFIHTDACWKLSGLFAE